MARLPLFPIIAAVMLAAVQASAPGVRAADQVANADPIKLDVVGECAEGMASFKIVNAGDKWPSTGKFNIYRTSGDALLSQRRMRLSDGQVASFRVKAGAEKAEFGLFIEPEWYERPFKYDAKLVC